MFPIQRLLVRKRRGRAPDSLVRVMSITVSFRQNVISTTLSGIYTHVQGQKFALEAEFEIETEKNFSYETMIEIETRPLHETIAILSISRESTIFLGIFIVLVSGRPTPIWSRNISILVILVLAISI